MDVYGAGQQGSVLIIEDDPLIRDTLGQILRDEGHAVVSLTDGHQALAYLALARGRPGLIVLDIMMPWMDGWEFLSRLRQVDERLGEIPVVVMSAADNVERLADVMQLAGALHKPFEIDALLSLVDRHCAREAPGPR